MWDKSSEYQKQVEEKSGLSSPGILMSEIVRYSSKAAFLRTHIVYLILN